MAEITLKLEDRELPLRSDVTTLGRVPDNDVSFPGDANVSRFHAEIERRNGEYFLIDLGSSNGTTVNGKKVTGETYLSPGDIIMLGGSSKVVFGSANGNAEPAPEAEGSDPDVAQDVSSGPLDIDAPSPAAEAAPTGSNTLLIVGGVVVCIAVLFVIAAAALFLFTGSSGKSGSGGIFGGLFGSGCDAKATIVKPETGETISKASEIEIEVENAECVSKAAFSVDGEVFATVEAPFIATIDPKDFPELSDGVDHNLTVTLMDEEGAPIGQDVGVLLAFETRAVTKPSPGPEITQTNTQQAGPTGSTKTASLIEVQEMSKRLVGQFAGKHSYNISNKQFLTEVQKRAAEYAVDGYFERAARYRDVINVAFVREQNVDAPLGFILAMSRSKFDPKAQGTSEGLWRMDTQFVTANAYNGLCGSETLSDPTQNCAAKAAALYMKALVFGVFDGDPIYSAAVFGKSPQDASIWKATLPANRADIWTAVKTSQEREQLVRFFAAGIVAENPQKFGLKNDRPLSELYRVTM